MKLLKIIRSHLFATKLNGNATFRRQFSSSVQSEWQKPNESDGTNTGITIYNCVHRGNVPFIVRNANCVTWYTCGPTVYDDAHIGHAVCYMKCDIIQRILRNHFKLNLVTAMNITDIDDKLIARSQTVNLSVEELANNYEHTFWQDIDALNIQRADIIVRVTESMPQIIAFIEKLLAQNVAYVASDGSVYFANSRTNGKLQNLESSTTNAEPKPSVNSSTIRKSVADFALWKAAKPGEPKWDVPWRYAHDPNVSTVGRPGWHTECAAMASHLFGNTIDIHAGGIDLKFPHHENEESQCCSYHNAMQWVNYWLHIGHLVTTDNVKMSKSLKNFITIKEFLKHYTRDQLRMACLMSTYHRHIEFSDETMLCAGDTLKRFVSFFDDTQRYLQSNQMQRHISNRIEILDVIQSTRTKIDNSLRNDFDTKSCILSLMDLITVLNRATNLKHQTSHELPAEALAPGNGIDVIKCGQNVVRQFFEMVGCDDIVANAFQRENVSMSQPGDTDGSHKFECLINDIMDYRGKLLSDAKTNKDKRLFEICDQLRSIYRQNGIIVKDHGTDSTWHIDNVATHKNRSNK